MEKTKKREYLAPSIEEYEIEHALLASTGIQVKPGGDNREDAGGAMSGENDSQWDAWREEV